LQALPPDLPRRVKRGAEPMRRRRVGLAVLLVLPALPAVPADECRAPSENIEEALTSAKTCEAAVDVFNACALGTGVDVARAALAQVRCEKGFLGSLSASSKKAYRAELARCWRQAKNGGSYRAMAAGCALNVAGDYSRAMRR